jgi:hypothetical protein
MDKKSSAILITILLAFNSSASAQSVSVEAVTYPNQRWQINRLHASESNNGWVIRGRLNAHSYSNPPSGHIDVAAYSHDGKLLAETTSSYSPALLTPKMRKKGGLRFSAALDQALPTGSVVKVAFHPSAPSSDSADERPAHSANIAK